MSFLTWLCAALTIALACYAVGHLVCALVVAVKRCPHRIIEARPTRAVSVLVPARNEGSAAVRAINSLLAQDHAGKVEITLLLKDRQDSSLPFLAAAWPEAVLDDSADRVTLTSSPTRTVAVAFTDVDNKSDKINWMTKRVDTPLVAVLDCDHQAHPDWLRTSVFLMEEKGARLIQGRRNPLMARGFFQLWDSLHQHVGCELFNHAFTEMGLTVFFTGTTMVMETALLRDHPLSQCITEDVNFSYELLLEGTKIAHNPYSGSDEEVSPDLFSFLARRRRWANGHTEAFFRHLGGILRAPLRWRDRLQFMLHGLHYMVCTGVFALHLVIGLLLMPQLSPTGAAAAAASSLVLAAWIAHSQRSQNWSTRISEITVLSLWVFPAVVIVMNLAVAWLVGDFSHTTLPIAGSLQLLGLVGLSAPLVVLVVGLARFGHLSAGTLIAVIVTWPIAFYLDICGVLIGITDRLARRRHWHTVARGMAQPSEAHSKVTQLVPLGILSSWRLEEMWREAPSVVGRGLRAMRQPRQLVPATLVLGISCGGVLYTPSNRIRVAEVDCQVLEHDGEPWIVPAERMENYCGPAEEMEGTRWSSRTGTWETVRDDALASVDPTYWNQLDTTFFCNDAVFDPENIEPGADGGIRLRLEAREQGDRPYTSASIATVTDRHLYGRFETVLKPARASGVITAFFLYRFDPWQEIDFEFLGKDTTKALLNVFYNPGEEGDLYNYGYRGTPVLVDLGFDAADDFHRYAVEWEPGEIRWFVDDRLIHRRVAGKPTPVPHLPMRFHVNVWPICSEELAGPLDTSALPTAIDVKSVRISTWEPAAKRRLPGFLGTLFQEPEETSWRDEASWIQPGR